MIKIATVSLITFVYGCSLLGWGNMIQKAVRIRLPCALRICLGMAGWICLGGIANLLRIGYPVVLDALCGSGLVFAAYALWRYRRREVQRFEWRGLLQKDLLLETVPAAILILTFFWGSAFTLSSPKVFNFHDDLEKYLSHPVRMLATGTLAGSPFSALGSETLGGQAFLQGFAVAHWPISYANTVDSVFAFTLCLAMVFNAAQRFKLLFWLIPLAVTMPVVINPQVVNVSSVYSGSALLLLLFIGPQLDLARRNSESSRRTSALFLGLVYASLVALKSIYLLLVAIHFAILCGGFWATARSRKQVFAWAVAVVTSSVVFVLPWVLLHAPHWIAAVSAAWHSLKPIAEPLYPRFSTAKISLFSTKPLFYGFGTAMVHYTIAMLGVGMWGVFILVKRRAKKWGDGGCRVCVVADCVAPLLFYVVSLIVIAPRLFGPEAGLRYLCPVIIAAVPAALLDAARTAQGLRAQDSSERFGGRKPLWAIAVTSMILVGLFYPAFHTRALQAWRHGSILAIEGLAVDPAYRTYMAYALSSQARETITTAQDAVPEGEPVLAWTPLALHLDYARNPIMDVEPAGLANPWLNGVSYTDAYEVQRYLSDIGVKYIIWQYHSFGVRSRRDLLRLAASSYDRLHIVGIKTLQFTNTLSRLVESSDIFYNDGSIVVARLPRMDRTETAENK